MRLINRRLEAVESRMPTKREQSIWTELGPYCTSAELQRLINSCELDAPLSPAELEAIATRAWQRLTSGLARDEAQRQGEAERAAGFSRFECVLYYRHGRTVIHGYDRLDTLDLIPGDGDLLTRLAEAATTMAEIEAAADAVGRLWLDGRPMTTAQFAELVLHGRCAPPHRRHIP